MRPQIAVPAVEEALSAQAVIPSDVEESAGEDGVVRDPKPKGTLEEAQSREHQMNHLPENKPLRILLHVEDPTDAETEKVPKADPTC